jgi:hypothetical protein
VMPAAPSNGGAFGRATADETARRVASSPVDLVPAR